MNDKRKLRLYSDARFLPPSAEPVFLLYPFWGKQAEDPRDPRQRRFDRLVEQGPLLFEMTESIEEADLAVLPADWGAYTGSEKLAQEFVNLAAHAGKPCLVCFHHDSSEPIPLQGNYLLILRTSLYRSRRLPNEFALPGFVEDFVDKYFGGVLPIRKKRPKPVVGFCGYVGPLNPSLWQHLVWLKNRLLIRIGLREPVGIFYRRTAIEVLQSSPRVETNFVLRASFYGGAARPGMKDYWDFAVMEKVRAEFVQNLRDSDYVLCVRGGGNYSYRLYEALSCGRIPIFVDTDCVLPYDFAVDWKCYCIWVHESELKRIDEIVADFHASLSPEDFEELQVCCYQFWREWLSPEGFAANFFRHLLVSGSMRANKGQGCDGQ